jgi:hypothetical protein
LAEQQTLNLRVLGSIPRRLTSIPINDLRGRRIHPIEKSTGDPQIVSLCGIAAVTQTLDVRAPKCQNARPTIPDGGMAVPVGDGFFQPSIDFYLHSSDSRWQLDEFHAAPDAWCAGKPTVACQKPGIEHFGERHVHGVISAQVLSKFPHAIEQWLVCMTLQIQSAKVLKR